MCLKIKSGKHIATKDFYTFKSLKLSQNGKLESTIMGTRYILNKLYKSRISKEISSYNNSIGRGIHSCLLSNEYFVSWINKINFSYYNNNRVIVLCKIPKGSTFYIGDVGDIVSNTLIVKEIIAYSEIDINLGYHSKKFKDSIYIFRNHYGYNSDSLRKMLLKTAPSWGLEFKPQFKK